MNEWKLLGIEPTDDIKIIKRAYAAKSKEVHPEEHPEEFRALHEAYETALSCARTYKKFAQETNAIKAAEVETDEKPTEENVDDSSDDAADTADSFNIDFDEVAKAADAEADEKSAEENVGDSSDNKGDGFNVDFDEVIEAADKERIKKIVSSTESVMTSLERAVSLPTEKEKHDAVINVLNSKFFHEFGGIPYFANELTEFVKSHPDLTDAFYLPVYIALQFDILETREQKGIYEELYSVFSQRGKLFELDEQSGDESSKSKWNSFTSIGTIAAIAIVVILRSIGRTDNLPDWAYPIVALFFLGFAAFVFIRNTINKKKALPGETSEETKARVLRERKERRKENFWNPVTRVTKLHYFSKLAFAVDLLLFNFSIIGIVNDSNDDGTSIALIMALFVISAITILYFLTVNTIILIKSVATKTKTWRPESKDEKTSQNILSAIFFALDLLLFFFAISVI